MNGQGSRRISSRSNMGSSQAESSNRSLSSNVERAQELLRRNDPSAYPSTLSLSMFSDNESSLHYDPKFSSASSRISDGRSATTTSDGRSTTFSPTNSNMKSIDSSSSSAQYVKMSDQSSMGKHNSSEYPPRYPSSHPKSTSGSSSSIQTSHQDATSNSHDDYSGSSDSDDNNLDDKEKYKVFYQDLILKIQFDLTFDGPIGEEQGTCEKHSSAEEKLHRNFKIKLIITL